MEDKDLDKLFQEKFEGIEAQPNPAVWDRISSSLDQKKSKKRLIPFWWLPAGVAALMMLAFWIGGVFESNPQETKLPEVVEQTSEEPVEVIPSQPEDTNENFKFNNREEETLVQKDEKPGEDETLSVQKSKRTRVSIDKKMASPSSTTELAINDSEKKSKADLSTHNDSRYSKINSATDQSSDPSSSLPSEDVLAFTRTEQSVKALQEDQTTDQESEKKDLFQVIEQQEALTEKEAGPSKKWSLNAAVAPVYYNTLGEGSPIHSNFASNDKNGEVNMSYGLNLAYSLNKKLKIRSGVHRVDLGYSTNDIVFSSSLNASTNGMIENINYGANAVNLVVSSRSPSTEDATLDATEADIIAQTPEQNGQMRQQMRYLEIPLEMQYRFVDKKLSVDLIGGVSSLLLIDNQVSLEADGRVTSMGEANNVNPVNFSTNLGIGLGYQIGEQWSLSVEPLFKYQLNTFEGEAGNFQPYSFGIYSGINFRF